MMPSGPKGKMFTMKKDQNNSCLKETNDIYSSSKGSRLWSGCLWHPEFICQDSHYKLMMVLGEGASGGDWCPYKKTREGFLAQSTVWGQSKKSLSTYLSLDLGLARLQSRERQLSVVYKLSHFMVFCNISPNQVPYKYLLLTNCTLHSSRYIKIPQFM